MATAANGRHGRKPKRGIRPIQKATQTAPAVNDAPHEGTGMGKRRAEPLVNGMESPHESPGRFRDARQNDTYFDPW